MTTKSPSIFGIDSMAIQPVAKSQSTGIAHRMTEQEIERIGNESSKKIADIAGQMLQMHKNSGNTEMGTQLDALIKSAKNMEIDQLRPGLFKRLTSKAANLKHDMMARFDTAQDKIDGLVKELAANHAKLRTLGGNADKLIEANKSYCSSLIQEIQMMEEVLADADDELAAAQANTENQTIMTDISVLQMRRDRIDKKIIDLQGLKLMSVQMHPNLVTFKRSVLATMDTYDTIINKVVPAYMTQFVMYLNSSALDKTQSLAAESLDLFDQTMARSGELAAQNMRQAATLSNRQIVNVDTLKKMHSDMMTGLADMNQIENAARQDRIRVASEMRELETKMIDAFTGKNR